MLRVNDIREMLKDAPVNEDGLKEIIGASFIADEESIFGEVNYDYVRREIEWYLSMSLNVNEMEAPVPTIWKNIANEDGMINSNYGWCVFSKENGSQYLHVLSKLISNPNSRQASIIYNRPSIHEEAGKDFICTNAVTYNIRDGKLHVVVQMRSNDAVFGYKNDYAWQKYLQHRIAYELDVGIGDIVWQVVSLHIYPRHFDLLYKEKSLL
jgi:thymidylate synthase